MNQYPRPGACPNPVCIFDLDGTLTEHNPEGRVRFLLQDPKDWKAFHAAAATELIDDTPRKSLITIANTLEMAYDIVIVTGRNEKYREQTELWLEKHGLSYDGLLMRGENDFRQDAIVKRELAWDFLDRVVCVFEDRDQCVSMWRELGLLCCQVAEGKF